MICSSLFAFFLFYKMTRFLLNGDVIFTTSIDGFYSRKYLWIQWCTCKKFKKYNFFFFCHLSLSLASDVAFKYVLISFLCLFFLYFSWGFISTISYAMPGFFVLLTKNFVQQAFFQKGVFKTYGVWQFSFSIHLKYVFWVVSQ